VSELLEPPCCFVGLFPEGFEEIVPWLPQTSSGDLGDDVAYTGIIATLMGCSEEDEQTGCIDDWFIGRVKDRLDKSLVD